MLPVTKNENLTNNENYNYGKEATPNVDNQILSSENENLANNNVTPKDNFNNEILRAMQDLKQELAQIKEQVSNINVNK